MTVTRTTISYVRSHPTSRKAFLRGGFEVATSFQILADFNKMLANPVKLSTLRTWWRRWSKKYGGDKRQP